MKRDVLTCLTCGQGNRLPADKPRTTAKCGTCGEPLFPARPVEIDAKTLAAAARRDTVPLLVDFWAPWCGPCRAMAPEFTKAAAALQGDVRLAKLDTQANPEAGEHHAIRSIPTLALFRDGREITRQSGALPAQAIVGMARGTHMV